ncbi:MAG TPA: hypothetical protein VJR89_40365 [Polyangiales bacterium]|nr:hypothetical protein [Polyangiales bacterium]
MVFGRFGLQFAGAWLAAACLTLAACGDDDSPSTDGGTDASTPPKGGAGGSNTIPRTDAGTPMIDPIKECDRFDPNSCPSGQVCDVLIRLSPGATAPTIYSGCVDKGRERGLGDPCDPDFTNTTPYRTEGLNDLVWRDQCGPGLICGADPKVRGGTSCRPTCSAGQDFEPAVLCPDSEEFCVGGDPYQQFCLPADGCDATYQTGCKPGEACYLRPKDDQSGFLTVCYPPAAKPVADGAHCEAYNACRPGSSCNGPIRKALRDWELADLACRPTCAADGTVPNASTDGDAGADDGGTPAAGGKCPGATKCAEYSKAGLSTAASKPPFGQCE